MSFAALSSFLARPRQKVAVDIASSQQLGRRLRSMAITASWGWLLLCFSALILQEAGAVVGVPSRTTVVVDDSTCRASLNPAFPAL